MTWPIPERLIKKFAESVTKLAVVEELDPFIEDAVKAAGVRVDYGKNVLPAAGELSREIVYVALSGAGAGCAVRREIRLEVWRAVSGRGLKLPVPVRSLAFLRVRRRSVRDVRTGAFSSCCQK